MKPYRRATRMGGVRSRMLDLDRLAYFGVGLARRGAHHEHTVILGRLSIGIGTLEGQSEGCYSAKETGTPLRHRWLSRRAWPAVWVMWAGDEAGS